MRVKVKRLSISNSTKRIINSDMSGYIKLNDEFLVYGLSIEKGINYVDIYDGNHLIGVPINLFKVIDNRISKYWEIKVYDDETITLWPKEFYTKYFHDNLSEGDPETVKAFKEAKEKMNLEFGNESSG